MEETISKKSKVLQFLQNYADHSTVDGCAHISAKNESLIWKVFWAIAIFLLIFLGIYWSKLNYDNWTENPVLTSAATTGYPIINLNFPAVTICSQGAINEILLSPVLRQLIDFHNNYSSTDDILPIVYSTLFWKRKINKVLNITMPEEELKIVSKLQRILDQSWKPFLDILLPLPTGFNVGIDDLIDVASTQVSSNPDLALRMLAVSSLKKEYPSVEKVEFLTDPVWEDQIRLRSNERKDKLTSMFKNVEVNRGFESYFHTMWYSTLPCFDIRGLTAEENGETEMLRKCFWKRRALPCASIFDPFPTDMGVCCTFNMNSANSLFVDSQYTQLITKLQMRDRKEAFQNATRPDWFDEVNFPEDGFSSGLDVVLDARSDIVSSETVVTDFSGFKVLIDSPSNFPFVKEKGFLINPGHLNLVAVSAISIDADESIKSVPPIKRNCHFEDEKYNIIVHKSYTQANCFLECKMTYAQDQLKRETNTTCTPWFLPFEPNEHLICDPWLGASFQKFMTGSEASKRCSKNCLSDCQRTDYHSKVSTQPFRKCDEKNLGISPFCDLAKVGELPTPQIFADKILQEYKRINKNGTFLNLIKSNTRNFGSNPLKVNIFHTNDTSYDAYEHDIAVLTVFFESPVVLRFLTSHKQTWTDFFANVGGLLGLCVGLSIVTVIELVCLCLRIFSTLIHIEK